MGKVTQHTVLDFEKSTYIIEHVTLDNGTEYIEIIQHYKKADLPDSKIKINIDNLPTILYTLSQYSDGLPKLETIKQIKITKSKTEKIVSAYLKGVSLKDLALQTGYKEQTIEMILINNDIVIVPPKLANTIKYQSNYGRRKRRN